MIENEVWRFRFVIIFTVLVGSYGVMVGVFCAAFILIVVRYTMFNIVEEKKFYCKFMERHRSSRIYHDGYKKGCDVDSLFLSKLVSLTMHISGVDTIIRGLVYDNIPFINNALGDGLNIKVESINLNIDDLAPKISEQRYIFNKTTNELVGDCPLRTSVTFSAFVKTEECYVKLFLDAGVMSSPTLSIDALEFSGLFTMNIYTDPRSKQWKITLSMNEMDSIRFNTSIERKMLGVSLGSISNIIEKRIIDSLEDKMLHPKEVTVCDMVMKSDAELEKLRSIESIKEKGDFFDKYKGMYIKSLGLVMATAQCIGGKPSFNTLLKTKITNESAHLNIYPDSDDLETHTKKAYLEITYGKDYESFDAIKVHRPNEGENPPFRNIDSDSVSFIKYQTSRKNDFSIYTARKCNHGTTAPVSVCMITTETHKKLLAGIYTDRDLFDDNILNNHPNTMIVKYFGVGCDKVLCVAFVDITEKVKLVIEDNYDDYLQDFRENTAMMGSGGGGELYHHRKLTLKVEPHNLCDILSELGLCYSQYDNILSKLNKKYFRKQLEITQGVTISEYQMTTEQVNYFQKSLKIWSYLREFRNHITTYSYMRLVFIIQLVFPCFMMTLIISSYSTEIAHSGTYMHLY